jgi:regulatory protein
MRVRGCDRQAVDDPEVVMAAAARLLEVRARSVDELRRRLASARYRAALIEDVIARLLEVGMLDDVAFARAWVESRDRARPRSERALRIELRAKGVDDMRIAQVLDERRVAGFRSRLEAADVATADVATADAAAADHLLVRNDRVLLRTGDERRRRQRAWALLARAGFDSDTVAAAVERAEGRWLAEGADTADDAEPPDRGDGT